MYLTASGRAVLAFMDPKQTDAVLAKIGKDGDKGSAEGLRTELAAIRNRLFAATERGSTVRVSSVAAPVWAAGPTPVGSIVLTSDSTTLPRSDFDRVGAIATNVAEQATRVLGGSYPITVGEAP